MNTAARYALMLLGMNFQSWGRSLTCERLERRLAAVQATDVAGYFQYELR